MNPLAPFLVPVYGTGFHWLEEINLFLNHQLVGFCRGVSKLGSGRLFRPFGSRAIDIALQVCACARAHVGACMRAHVGAGVFVCACVRTSDARGDPSRGRIMKGR